MTEQKHELENSLFEYEREIMETATAHRVLMIDAASARADYDLETARAVIAEIDFETKNGVKRTVDVRDAVVKERVKNHLIAARLAEAHAESSKEYLRSLQNALSALQSRVNLFRVDASLLSHKT